MLETLFLAGAFLQLAWMCTSHKSFQIRSATTATVLLLSALIWGISVYITDAFIDSLLMVGMVSGGLIILALGFFTMKGAKVWRPVELLALQSIMLLALSTIQNTELWILATQIGLPLSLLCILLARYSPLLRIVPYLWTLILSLALEVVYVLPIMGIQEPPPFDIFLVGSLFATLGVSGFFALKFSTMCLASLLHRPSTYRVTLSAWMNKHLPMRYAGIEDSLLVLLIVASSGSFLFGTEWIPTTLMLLLLGVLLRQKIG